MGSIAAPIPDYVPNLPERTVSERLLSASQLETVVYAGHAWSQFLPGRFMPSKEGVGLEETQEGRAYRKGYFLRSEEHTSELQSLMRTSYAVFCLKKQKQTPDTHIQHHHNPK